MTKLCSTLTDKFEHNWVGNEEEEEYDDDEDDDDDDDDDDKKKLSSSDDDQSERPPTDDRGLGIRPSPCQCQLENVNCSEANSLEH